MKNAIITRGMYKADIILHETPTIRARQKFISEAEVAVLLHLRSIVQKWSCNAVNE